MAYLFLPEEVPWTGPWVTARRAIFCRLYPRFWPTRKQEDEIVARAQNVLYLWRQRVKELRELGWHGTATESGFEYKLNCSPSLVHWNKPHQKTRICRESLICPWCWVRCNVFDAWSRLQAGIKQLGLSWRSAARDGYVLFFTEDVSPLLRDQEHLEHAVCHLRQALAMNRQGLSQYGSRALGYTYYTALTCCESGWRFRLRYLGIARRDQFDPEGVLVVPCAKKELPRLVARYAAYPAYLLNGPRVDRVAAILNRCRGLTLRQVVGVCREVTPSEEKCDG